MITADVYRTVDEAEASGSAMLAFQRFCERRTGRAFPDYTALHAWAISEREQFWTLLLHWTQLPFSGALEPAITEGDMERTEFFPMLSLNYAKCLLRDIGSGSDAEYAVVGWLESGERSCLTRRELRSAVERCAAGLLRMGLKRGDLVIAVVRNRPEAVIACLAAVTIGATWSSVAPDMGDEAVLDRFRQLHPELLFTDTEYTLQGVTRPLRERTENLIRELPSIKTIVTLGGGEKPEHLRAGVTCVSLEGLSGYGMFGIDQWVDFPFNHPLFILFSSGTTGAPKGLIHGAGGTLIEHYKELVLHTSLRPGEKLFFHTSTGWMMWNWQLSALVCGATIVLFDGSPTFPNKDALLRVVDFEQVTAFGTSATYLHVLEQLKARPQGIGRFERLRTILSTGSILYESQYDWIGSHFGDVKVQSISGGTDIIGCFVLGNPLLPIHRGESQCISLGLDVRVMTDGGLSRSGEGDLVCVNAFPSRPIGLVGDPTAVRFHEAYFAQNPGMWTHGDRVSISDRGSVRVLGRSDGVLNVRGVRVGPAEIYRIVLALPDVLQALSVEQRAENEPGGTRLVLLLVLREGVTLDQALTVRIRKELSQKGSPYHVPALIVQVAALPSTHSGKLSEMAVRNVLNGEPVLNRAALRNPESLDAVAEHPRLRRRHDRSNG